MLSLRIQTLGDAAIIRCAGRITFSDAHALRPAVLHDLKARTLVLDLAGVMAIDAAGLGKLVELQTWSGSSGIDLKLMNVPPRLEDLMALTNLESVFEICTVREMLDLLCRAICEDEWLSPEASVHGVADGDPISDPGLLLST